MSQGISNISIPYGHQSIANEEIQAVVDVLSSDFLTQGPKIAEFEQAVADYCGAKYAIAVSSGTAALHIAALSTGLKKGDEGITSPNTFLASANCIIYCGATPNFADIKHDTFCIDSDKIKQKINSKTKVIIPVHFSGHPCEMDEIWNIAQDSKLFVIEDAAHAIGSEWQDQHGKWHKVGSCSHSHLTTFSFHPIKTMTTGEGGMVLTNDEKLAEKCRMLRNHGMTKNHTDFEGQTLNFLDIESHQAPWYYEMQCLGYNYRITDIQCAIGLVQLKKLASFVEKRREIWNYYNEQLSGVGDLIIPIEKEGFRSCWHLYVLRTLSRNDLLLFLRSKNIIAHAMYIPVHLQSFYRNQFGFKENDFPIAETYIKECLILPIFPGLSKNEIDYIISTIKEFYE